EFAVKLEHAIDVYAMFFDRLSEASTEIVGSSRKEVARTNGLQSVGTELLSLLEHVGNELEFESETYPVA
ncbi:ATP-dependent DNA helicase, partial [Priestia megaterium]